MNPPTASFVAVTSRVAGSVNDVALNSGYGVHPQLVPCGTESPSATIDQSRCCGSLVAGGLVDGGLVDGGLVEGAVLVAAGALEHPLTKIAHANATTT